MFVQLWRVARAGLHNFLRNLWLSTAATVVMTITLSLILISFVSSLALTHTIDNYKSKIDVSIFLSGDLTPDQIESFRVALLGDSNVNTVVFKSKADALADYRRQNAGNTKLLNAISDTDNPLPPSLEVKPKNPDNTDSIVAITNQSTFHAMLDTTANLHANDRKKVVDSITSFSNFFQTTGIVISTIFLVISILIIFNTIRMAIFTRRDEIEIMKLVGATKWFIRGPFLFEACMYGIVGAVFATGFSYALILWGGPHISSYVDLGSVLTTFKQYPVFILLGEMGIGIVIGIFSSLLAMGRYLRL
jgi:cell division transport system permease protein